MRSYLFHILESTTAQAWFGVCIQERKTFPSQAEDHRALLQAKRLCTRGMLRGHGAGPNAEAATSCRLLFRIELAV